MEYAVKTAVKSNISGWTESSQRVPDDECCIVLTDHALVASFRNCGTIIGPKLPFWLLALIYIDFAMLPVVLRLVRFIIVLVPILAHSTASASHSLFRPS